MVQEWCDDERDLKCNYTYEKKRDDVNASDVFKALSNDTKCATDYNSVEYVEHVFETDYIDDIYHNYDFNDLELEHQQANAIANNTVTGNDTATANGITDDEMNGELLDKNKFADS